MKKIIFTIGLSLSCMLQSFAWEIDINYNVWTVNLVKDGIIVIENKKKPTGDVVLHFYDNNGILKWEKSYPYIVETIVDAPNNGYLLISAEAKNFGYSEQSHVGNVFSSHPPERFNVDNDRVSITHINNKGAVLKSQQYLLKGKYANTVSEDLRSTSNENRLSILDVFISKKKTIQIVTGKGATWYEGPIFFLTLNEKLKEKSQESLTIKYKKLDPNMSSMERAMSRQRFLKFSSEKRGFGSNYEGSGYPILKFDNNTHVILGQKSKGGGSWAAMIKNKNTFKWEQEFGCSDELNSDIKSMSAIELKSAIALKSAKLKSAAELGSTELKSATILNEKSMLVAFNYYHVDYSNKNPFAFSASNLVSKISKLSITGKIEWSKSYLEYATIHKILKTKDNQILMFAGNNKNEFFVVKIGEKGKKISEKIVPNINSKKVRNIFEHNNQLLIFTKNSYDNYTISSIKS